MKPQRLPARLRSITLTALAALTLGGCAAVVVGGAVGTALVASDRRTSGTQLEDQAIELKAVPVSYTHLTLPTKRIV